MSFARVGGHPPAAGLRLCCIGRTYSSQTHTPDRLLELVTSTTHAAKPKASRNTGLGSEIVTPMSPRKAKKKMSAVEAEQEFEENPEIKAVYDWRWANLFEAGYDSRLCDYFASRNDLDLGRLVSVKRSGCSDALALRIFS